MGEPVPVSRYLVDYRVEVCHIEALYAAKGSPNLPQVDVVDREDPQAASPRGQLYRQPLLL
jgi:hypothetical protein